MRLLDPDRRPHTRARTRTSPRTSPSHSLPLAQAIRQTIPPSLGSRIDVRAMGVDPHQNAPGSNATAGGPSSSRLDGTDTNTTARGSKRKLQAAPPNADGDGDKHGYCAAGEARDMSAEDAGPRKKAPRPAAPTVSAGGEKRLRRYRQKPPGSFAAILERATTQRFFVLSRTLCGTDDCPELFLQVSGSTGNVYNICIARQPTCDCPHAKAGNQCKHVVFVLKKVLRARTQYVYQLALLNTELKDILDNAPDPAGAQGGSGPHDRNRKLVGGDCPICFEGMGPGPGGEQLVWCKATCGQNVHRQCFEMWAATRRQAGGAAAEVSCPYCRSPWQGDDEVMKTIDIRRGRLTHDGYYNVADQLGVSTRRDYSTYSSWWSGRPRYRGRRSYW